MTKIGFEIIDSDVLFTSAAGQEAALISALESALGVKSRTRRILIFVKRVEFVIDREVVPLFIDEDGHAHIEMRKNSVSVKRRVFDKIKRSVDFQEAD